MILLTSACSKHSAKEFISIQAPLIALTHIRVIDGTGGLGKEDQTIIIESGRIREIGASATRLVPLNAKVIDLHGRTAIPGIVGMHDHLFYAMDNGDREVPMNVSFPRLYLACGVTTIRTAGAVDFKRDWDTKEAIARGEQAGPKIHLGSPYINRRPEEPLELTHLAELMNSWADQEVNTYKVYENVGRAELATIIAVAHKRGLKVAGHLCAVGFSEAAALGIDSLEHGLAADTEFYSKKIPDKCPSRSDWLPELARIDVNSTPVRNMIKDLVDHHVAVTSTLPVYEAFIDDQFIPDPRMQEALSPSTYATVTEHKPQPNWAAVWRSVFKKEMDFERQFFKAGGLLVAGVDPTGWGGVIAGFGDQRELELLVAAGFTPEEVIQIATLNGAKLLGESERIGSIEVGKQADIAIIRGNPLADIRDVRNVEIVFKDGVGYDSARLITSVKGMVGEQ